MFLDIAEVDRGDLACDVCIVGAGAIGMAVAREFLRSRHSVVVLEAGGEGDEADTQSLYDSVIIGSRYQGAMEGRSRRLGGTTNIWGGQALPMDCIDFDVRDWVPHSGWPIDRDVLTPYYRRAARYLRIDDHDFDNDVFKRFAIRSPFARDSLRMHVAKWAPRPRLVDIYRRELSSDESVKVILHANVTSLSRVNENEIDIVEARSLAGHTLSVRARHVILCLGAIETARLLLKSEDGRGLGNDNDLVGRYLMDHPSGRIGTLRARDEREAQKLFSLFYIGRHKYSVRLSASEVLQKRARLLNVSCGFSFEWRDNHAMVAIRDARRAFASRSASQLGAALARTARSAPEIAETAWSLLVLRRAFTRGATIALVANCEQAPDPESHVSLSSQKDALGIPKSEIHWAPNESTGRTTALFAAEVAQELQRANVGTFEPEPWLADWRNTWRTQLRDAYHPMGTARMASTPANGVVDGDCRIFGTANGWIAGTAVFPTAGHSNPTLTAIALGLRVADSVKDALTR